jgi:hypothetical protein
MAEFRVELNSAGVQELLKSNEMAGLCRSLAQGIANRAGSGYMVTTHTGPTRVNASVITATAEAARENMKNNTLLKAVK